MRLRATTGTAVLMSLVGCGITVESRQILDSEAIMPGTECQNGGNRVFTGIDENENGQLEASERAGSTLLCNPPASSNPMNDPVQVAASLTSSASTDCSNVNVMVGSDENGDGTLSLSESQSTARTCVPPPSSIVMNINQLAAADGSVATRLTAIENRVTELERRLTTPSVPIIIRPNPGPNEFPDLAAALAALQDVRLTRFTEIQIQPGTYTHPRQITVLHPNGNNIGIEGAAPGPVILEFPSSNGIVLAAGNELGFLGGLTLRYTGSTADFGNVGLQIQEGAVATVAAMVVENFGENQVEVRGGRLRTAEFFPANVRNIETRCNPIAIFNIGIKAHRGGAALLRDSSASVCTFGFWAVESGFVDATRGVADNSTIGFLADAQGMILADGGQANANDRGFVVLNNGTMLARDWTSGPGRNNREFDVDARDSGTFRSVVDLQEPGITLPNCGRVNTDRSGILRGCTPTSSSALR